MSPLSALGRGGRERPVSMGLKLEADPDLRNLTCAYGRSGPPRRAEPPSQLECFAPEASAEDGIEGGGHTTQRDCVEAEMDRRATPDNLNDVHVEKEPRAQLDLPDLRLGR